MTDQIVAGFLDRGVPASGASEPIAHGVRSYTLPAGAFPTAQALFAAPRNHGPVPPWRGTGTLSGTSPYVVTYGGSAATCILDLFDRASNWYIASTTASAIDGSFSFTGLSTVRTFDVRARGDGFTPDENDLILASVTPA